MSDLGNASFRVRVIAVSSSTSRDFFLDWVGVRVHAGVPAPPTLSAVGVSPASVTGGSSSTGTATLTSAAPAGGAVVDTVLQLDGGHGAGQRDGGGGSHQRNVHGHHQYGHIRRR